MAGEQFYSEWLGNQCGLEGQTEPTRPDYLAALKGARTVTRVQRFLAAAKAKWKKAKAAGNTTL